MGEKLYRCQPNTGITRSLKKGWADFNQSPSLPCGLPKVHVKNPWCQLLSSGRSVSAFSLDFLTNYPLLKQVSPAKVSPLGLVCYDGRTNELAFVSVATASVTWCFVHPLGLFSLGASAKVGRKSEERSLCFFNNVLYLHSHHNDNTGLSHLRISMLSFSANVFFCVCFIKSHRSSNNNVNVLPNGTAFLQIDQSVKPTSVAFQRNHEISFNQLATGGHSDKTAELKGCNRSQ